MNKLKIIIFILSVLKCEYVNSFLSINNNKLFLNNNLLKKKNNNNNRIYLNLESKKNTNINGSKYTNINDSKYTNIIYSSNYSTFYKKQIFLYKNIINSANNINNCNNNCNNCKNNCNNYCNNNCKNNCNNDENNKNMLIDNNILLLGELNEKSCFDLIKLLNNKEFELLNKDIPKEEKYINLFIQSQGGSLLSTLSVVDEIKKLNIPLYTYIKGYAASSATLLSILGNKRFISENSLMMIHGPKIIENDADMTLLKIKDINQNINLLTNIIKKIYLENTKINEQLLNELLYHNVWISSKDALKHGLVDEIN